MIIEAKRANAATSKNFFRLVFCGLGVSPVRLSRSKSGEGGVMPQKGTVVMVSGLGDDPQKGMSKCAAYECPMVVPGTNHHVVVLCQPSSRKLHPGQRLIDSNKRSVMPPLVLSPLLVALGSL